VNFAPGKMRQGAKAPRKRIYNVPAQEVAKQRAVWLAFGERRICSNEGITRNRLKFAGVHQTGKPISAISGPNFAILWDMWQRQCCLTSFFPIAPTCLICEFAKIQPDKVVRRCPNGEFFTILCALYFSEPLAVHFRPAF